MRTVLLLICLLGLPARASEAEALLRDNRVDEAVPVARREAVEAPGDIAAQERWIDLMLSLGIPGPVQTWYAERARTEPSSPDAHYLVGRAATDLPGSQAAYERALRLDPDHARSWMGLGALARATGQHREAAEHYQRALRLDPDLGEAWGGLLASAATSGDEAAVTAVAKSALEHVPNLAEAWLVVGSQPGEPGTAALREGVRRLPWDPRLQAALADRLLSAGDAAAALAAASTARRLDPLSARAIVAWLHARSMAQDTLDPAGHEALRAARALPPDAPGTRKTWDALVSRYPRSSLPRLGRGSLLARTDPTAARADLEQAVALDPDNDEALATLGLLLLEHGDASTAYPLLRRALGARQLDAKLALATARAAQGAGNTPAALALVDEATKRHPYHLELAVHHVSMLSAAGMHEQAMQAARASAARISDPRMELTVAAAATEAGRYLDAAVIYEDLAKRTGSDALASTAARLRRRAAEGQ